MKARILKEVEISFLKKLCQPKAFEPTAAERTMLAIFLKDKIAMCHDDGSIEVTNHGADCYMATIA